MTDTPLIVCFGDSLTAGCRSGLEEWTPYGAFLQERLGSRARVRVAGLPGDLTAGMLGRFPSEVLRHAPKWVVILGGTNDLGHAVPPDQIVANLRTLYGQALEAGVRPVGVTLPSIRPPGEPSRVREEVASHLALLRATNAGVQEACQDLGLDCVDVFSATSGADELLAEEFSSDGLHLTRVGYERFAQEVFEVVFA